MIVSQGKCCDFQCLLWWFQHLSLRIVPLQLLLLLASARCKQEHGSALVYVALRVPRSIGEGVVMLTSSGGLWGPWEPGVWLLWGSSATRQLSGVCVHVHAHGVGAGIPRAVSCGRCRLCLCVPLPALVFVFVLWAACLFWDSLCTELRSRPVFETGFCPVAQARFEFRILPFQTPE